MAATFIFKLGSLDLSAFVRANPDDAKLDPYGAPFLEPAFTSTPFSDGQALVSTTVANREQMWFLYLKDATKLKPQLHALIQSINVAAAQRPLSVEWRDDGAGVSTFYDVNFVRFEPDFNFRRSQSGYAAGVLHVWTNGYGHTGTTRVTATAAGTGIFLTVPIASVAGDAPALMDTTVTDGGAVPSLGRIVAVAPIVNPSYAALVPAASLVNAQPGATLVGASGAQGSQYLGLPVSPTGGASGVAFGIPLPGGPSVYGGDNRLLLVVKSGIDAGVGVNANDPYGNSMGATAVASMSQGWGLIDCGVCRLPTTGFPTLPIIPVQAGAIWASGAAGPAILASPAGLAVNEAILLPDKNLCLLFESKQGGSVLSKDGFAGFVALRGQNDSLGNPWSGGWNAASAAAAGGLLTEGGGFVSMAGASVFSDSAHLAGILTDSMLISAKPQTAIGGEYRLLKETATGVYVQARWSGASQYLELAAATNATLNRLASVAIASAFGIRLRLSLRVAGGQGVVNLSRDDGGGLLVAGASSAFASLGASSAAVAGAGVPGLSIQNDNTGGGAMFSWEADTIPSSNLQAYDSYRIDGPNQDSYRTSSAGVFAGQKLVAVQRGGFPKMQPSTTSVAIVAAAFDQGPANDLISAAVSVKERFVYAR